MSTPLITPLASPLRLILRLVLLAVTVLPIVLLRRPSCVRAQRWAGLLLSRVVACAAGTAVCRPLALAADAPACVRSHVDRPVTSKAAHAPSVFELSRSAY